MIVLNGTNGIYQNSIFGLVSDFPFKYVPCLLSLIQPYPFRYTNAVIIGNNFCGTFVSLVSIISIYRQFSPPYSWRCNGVVQCSIRMRFVPWSTSVSPSSLSPAASPPSSPSRNWYHFYLCLYFRISFLIESHECCHWVFSLKGIVFYILIESHEINHGLNKNDQTQPFYRYYAKSCQKSVEDATEVEEEKGVTLLEFWQTFREVDAPP